MTASRCARRTASPPSNGGPSATRSGRSWRRRPTPGAPTDDKTFTLKLKKPFPLTLEALAKPSSNVPFIMPERIAKTDAFKNIEDATGSGPFKFVKDEWVPGNKVVYVKNTDYVPRKEAPSWAAGGKVVKVDRVEWIYIPDSATAAAALNAGEADWWEQMPPDLIPLLARNKDITVKNIDPLGSMGMIRFNFLHPPFDNPKMRQAVLYAVNQQEYVIGIAGDPKNGKPCYSYFTCGTPLASEVGAEPLKGKRDFDKAKQLVKEAGYKGEKIVIINATDQPIVHSQSLQTLEVLKKLGLNAEIQSGDWGTLITRRAVREPIDKGGWSIFHTWLVGSGHGQSGGELPDPRHRQDGLVRLADGRENGGAARSLVQRQGSGRIQAGGGCGAASRLRVRALRAHRAVHPADRLPLEHHRGDHRADLVAVERGEEVAKRYLVRMSCRCLPT